MAPEGLGTHIVCQIGLVVRDIEATARAYADVFGLAMPEIQRTDPLAQAHTRYRGEPTEARAKLAFFPMGEQVSLELIEPDGRPSTWQEFLDTHGEGVHHIAFTVGRMGPAVAYLEGKGIRQVQRGDFPGGQYSYMDAADRLKVILELLSGEDETDKG